VLFRSHVRQVYYKETGNLQINGSDIGGAIPIEYFNHGGGAGGFDPVQPVYGRMGEWVQYKQYEQLYNRVSSQIGGWEWVGGYENIKLYPVPYRSCNVIVHYLQKCHDFKQTNQALQEGSLAYAMQMLGRIRGKYSNPPGPNGGIQNDGASMLQEANQMIKDWEERLINRYGDFLPITLG
jgi:hypothetical protein